MTSISSLGSLAWSNYASINARSTSKTSQSVDAESSANLELEALQAQADESSSASASQTSSDSIAQQQAMLAAPSTMQFAQSHAPESDSDFEANSNTEPLSAVSSDADTQAVAPTSEEDAAATTPPAGAAPAPVAAAEDDGSTSTEATAAAGGAAPVGGAGGGSATVVYDELDTNEDGEVSLEERLAGARKEAETQAQASAESSTTTASSKDQDWARQAMTKAVNAAYGAASCQMSSTSTFSYAA